MNHPRMMAVWLFKYANKGKLMALFDQNLPSEDAMVIRSDGLPCQSVIILSPFRCETVRQEKFERSCQLSRGFWGTAFFGKCNPGESEDP